MERKKRSKGSVWEFCYANFFPERLDSKLERAGRNCTLTHIHTTAAKLVVRIAKALPLIPFQTMVNESLVKNGKPTVRGLSGTDLCSPPTKNLKATPGPSNGVRYGRVDQLPLQQAYRNRCNIEILRVSVGDSHRNSFVVYQN